MKIKPKFKGVCNHCKSKITSHKAEFAGYIATGKPMGYYTICPRCGWETIIEPTRLKEY